MEKTCTKCGETKPLDKFKKDRRRVDGRGSYCKACSKQYRSAYKSDPEARARYKARYGDRYKGRYEGRYEGRYKERYKGRYARLYKDRYKEKKRITTKLWQIENPLAVQAHRTVHRAIREGIMPKASTLPCNHCSEMANDYHHHVGYEPDHWLDVIPLCQSCHRFAHSQKHA